LGMRAQRKDVQAVEDPGHIRPEPEEGHTVLNMKLTLEALELPAESVVAIACDDQVEPLRAISQSARGPQKHVIRLGLADIADRPDQGGVFGQTELGSEGSIPGRAE